MPESQMRGTEAGRESVSSERLCGVLRASPFHFDRTASGGPGTLTVGRSFTVSREVLERTSIVISGLSEGPAEGRRAAPNVSTDQDRGAP